MRRSYCRLTCGWFAILGLLGLVGCKCVPNTIPANSVRNASCCDDGADARIDFLALRQPEPDQYVLDGGDTLGIYIQGITGDKETPPPVHFPDGPGEKPTIGYPVPIRDDGYISLPLIDPIKLSGMTLAEAEKEIRDAYVVKGKILLPGNDKIIVSLMKSRSYNILVVREDLVDNRHFSYRRNEYFVDEPKQGQTFSIDLPAYKNDVLHALSETGGMPGESARNEIVILRGAMKNVQNTGIVQAVDGTSGYQSTNMVRIPMKFKKDNIPVLNQSDIILKTGDVIYIEGRDREVFYTGGLLDGGRFPLPRDYEIDILEAIAMAGGSVSSAAGSSAGSTFRGIGNVMPASKLTILRSKNCKHCVIEVDLRKAICDPSQRVIVQPGDMIILEYRPNELLVNSIVSLFQFGGIYRLFNAN